MPGRTTAIATQPPITEKVSVVGSICRICARHDPAARCRGSSGQPLGGQVVCKIPQILFEYLGYLNPFPNACVRMEDTTMRVSISPRLLVTSAPSFLR